MAENVVSENDVKLLEIIKEKDERIEQLEKENESLQSLIKKVINECLQAEFTTKENLIQILGKKFVQLGVSAEQMPPMQMLVDAETRQENDRQIMKGQKDETQVQQPENKVDSDLESEASEVKALGIELLLLKVLKCMNTRDLQHNCRLVSREWRDLSTQVLLKRTTFQIQFSSSCYHREFVVGQTPTSGGKLGELTTFLTTSKTFPCANFIFKGNVMKNDAQGFLSHFGSHVKGLKLIGPQNLNHIRNLLVEQIPHLETLHLSEFQDESLPSPNPLHPAPVPQNLTRLFPEDSPAPQLSFLTSLKVGKENAPPLIQEILDAAPNLQACFGIRTTEEIESLKSRIHVVKGLIIKLGVITVEDLCKMVPILQQLHLKSLDYSIHNFAHHPELAPAFCGVISKILSWSQGSLKKVKLTSDPNFQSLIQWPQLEKVGELTLSGDLTKDFPRLFAPVEKDVQVGVGVSKIFPNLDTIHLKEIHRIKEEEDLTIFEEHPQISTVKSLKFSKPQPQSVRLFLPLFPNVNLVSLAKVQNFACFAPVIWKMRGLKSLEIEFNCDGSEIDAGFTGMDKITCKFLGTAGRCRLEPYEVDKFRVQPSILEATELEQLFIPSGFLQREKYNQNLGFEHTEFNKATSVSFKYAFNLMPKLRVFSL